MLVVAFKKILKTFYHFSRLFPGLENCWVNFKTFFKNSRLYEPALEQEGFVLQSEAWSLPTLPYLRLLQVIILAFDSLLTLL